MSYYDELHVGGNIPQTMLNLLNYVGGVEIFLHYDDRFFVPGEIIEGNHYDLCDEVKHHYSYVPVKNLENMVYMATKLHPEWIYKHLYLVIPTGERNAYLSHYTPWLAELDQDRSVVSYKQTEGNTEGLYDETIKKNFIYFMSQAYMGDDIFINRLDKEFGWERDGEVEIVASNAQIVCRIK